MQPKVLLLSAIAMIAFAANSVLGRMALMTPENDPLSYTIA